MYSLIRYTHNIKITKHIAEHMLIAQQTELKFKSNNTYDHIIDFYILIYNSEHFQNTINITIQLQNYYKILLLKYYS